MSAVVQCTDPVQWYSALLAFPSKGTFPHVFAGFMNPGVALIVNSCGTNNSANVRDGTLSHKIDPLLFCVHFKF